MISKWAAHLKTPEEKEQFEKDLRANRWLIDRLQQILKEDLQGVEDTEASTKVYDLPNWEYRQADGHGTKRTLRRYIKLLNLDPQET